MAQPKPAFEHLSVPNHLIILMRDHRFSTFESVRLLGIFKETIKKFPVLFVVTKRYILTESQDVFSYIYGDKTRYFEPEHDLSLSLIKWVCS